LITDFAVKVVSRFTNLSEESSDPRHKLEFELIDIELLMVETGQLRGCAWHDRYLSSEIAFTPPLIEKEAVTGTG
jgi:hypothetical protein